MKRNRFPVGLTPNLRFLFPTPETWILGHLGTAENQEFESDSNYKFGSSFRSQNKMIANNLFSHVREKLEYRKARLGMIDNILEEDCSMFIRYKMFRSSLDFVKSQRS